MMAKVRALWRTVQTAIERLDSKLYFVAIRRGLALPLPLIMVGAFTLLIRFPPSAGIRAFLLEAFGPRLDAFCDSVLAGTFGIGSLVAMYGFAETLTTLHNQRLGHRQVNPTIAAMVVMSCFFTALGPVSGASLFVSLSLGQGLFGALIVASIGGSLFLKLCGVRHLRIPIGNFGNDPLVSDVFTVIPAASLTILTFAALKAMLHGLNWPSLPETISSSIGAPLPTLANSLSFCIGYEAASQFLWLFGIHGPNALHVVQQHVLEPAASANVAALAAGARPPFIFTFDFFSAFARMGGSGGTLSLLLALLVVSRTARQRKLALLMLLPALFNVNEPLLFGLPLVLNPTYAVPFVLAPLVQALIAYAAIGAHLMPRLGHSIAWTTPALYSGYAVTGSLAGTLVQLLCLAAGALVYAPFVRIADTLAAKKTRQVLASLLRMAEAPEAAFKTKRFLELPGNEGRMAVVLANDLKEAMKAGEQIFLEFQPQIDTQTGRIFGAEALLRWQHPTVGRIAPPIVVTLADDTGQTEVLGLHILSLACRQRAGWRGIVSDDFVIAVNLSPRQLLEREFHRRVIEILERESLSPSLLELEITEYAALLPEANVLDNLKQLRDAGVKVALDDFGMGHTSLHYLREFPLDTVKIDKSLADVTAGSINEHIVRSIADLSRTLDLSLVVEGVENELQLKRLRTLGCHRFQGYFFSFPLAPDVCAQFVAGRNGQTSCANP
ncbi:EAL domain-containing protein [Trinickia dinghuensis]|uniref:EAL domain-containing protein n=1 Tax=Trinickia dinghuensis TaxID=2291023 RepID=A0A3D8K6I2_9BURK|nr:EAL domain-containing protein [Trinickia dinghuensis]RDV00506.1 EAL domain-containing protein [Trinickia dinghuensis]